MARELILHNYSDYRDYLSDFLQERRKKERGVQTSLAQLIGCQPAYVSKVLAKGAHFSLEQAERTSEFCHHGESEKHFLMLLVQFTRAGTNSLRNYFLLQLDELRVKNKSLKEHMKLEKLNDLETQLQYYSNWKIAAVHVLLTISKFRTRNSIASKLNISIADVNTAIDFLKSKGMVEEGANELRVGKVGLHLGAESLVIRQHHSNWRLKALDSIFRGNANDLHYSSVVSIAESDFDRLRRDLVKWIAHFKREVEASKEETLVAISFDFYGV